MQSKEEIEKAKEYFKYQIELAHIQIKNTKVMNLKVMKH